MRLEQMEGYVLALKDAKKIIEEKIEAYEYEISECYSNMMESSQ